jgi:hypothetical protein
MTTPETTAAVDLDALYASLATADEKQDTEGLAEVGWRLYGLLGTVKANLDALRARTRDRLTE